MIVNKRPYMLLFLLLICKSSLTLSAQVTIGSGVPPIKTAILQIKDQEPDDKNNTCRKGGVLLPRTGLIKLNTLEPFMNTDHPDYEQEKSLATGLFVFNTTNSDEFSPGLYYWDGDKWSKLSIGESDPNDNNGGVIPVDPKTPTDYTNPETLKLPNSYIVSPNTTIDIPVIKGYAVWKQIINEDDADLDGDVEVDLLWQDQKSLISSVKLADGDKKHLSTIRIKTNDNGIFGNAVVTLKIDNQVFWSWHIWITNYDPESTDTQYSFNGYKFMDRNLGATSCEFGSVKAKGLLYQWGRKNPFPSSSSCDGSDEKTLYDITNVSLNSQKVDINTLTAINDNYLKHSIRMPQTFLFTTDNLGDWYTTKAIKINNHLWNDINNNKGAFDPCPKGWRVPPLDSNDQSLWNNATLSENNFVAGTGITFKELGYYPAMGYQAYNNGTYTHVGHKGNYWISTAPPHNDAKAFYLFFESYSNPRKDYIPRANGFPVRCVSEE